MSAAPVPPLDAFPADFGWGVATAAYQIEGSTEADGRGASVWDTFSHTPGRVRDGDTGDVACDAWRRWPEDVALMARLGIRVYRFSVAWPRILPDGVGRVEARGLDGYERLVDALLAAGITPMPTLFHWDLPQALEDRGGWRSPDAAAWFAGYADVVARRLGDRVGRWITLNEPQVVAHQGHALGIHAPGLRDWGAALRAAHGMHLAHRDGMAAIRAAAPGARVGIALNLGAHEPASEATADRAAWERVDATSHRWFLDPVFGRGYPSLGVETFGALLDGIDLAAVEDIAPPDVLGLNYYTRELIRDAPDRPPVRAAGAPGPGERTAMGWEVHPDGLRSLLVRLAEDYAPAELVVTENGAAFDETPDAGGRVDDRRRVAYLAAHLESAAEAIRAGVPLTGYCAWSLLDNFEWAEGYAKRFGLVRVDYPTQRRVVKASGAWYAALIADHAARTTA